MIDMASIRLTMRERLLSVSGVDGAKLAVENVSFDPPPDEIYFREYFGTFLNEPIANAVEQADGFYEVHVVAPLNTGTNAVDDLARRIGEAFPPASSIEGPVSVTLVDRFPFSGTRADEGRWARGLRVGWRAFHQFKEN